MNHQKVFEYLGLVCIVIVVVRSMIQEGIELWKQAKGDKFDDEGPIPCSIYGCEKPAMFAIFCDGWWNHLCAKHCILNPVDDGTTKLSTHDAGSGRSDSAA